MIVYFSTMQVLLMGSTLLCRLPKTLGLIFFNCKGTFLVVLLAICDANYKYNDPFFCMLNFI